MGLFSLFIPVFLLIISKLINEKTYICIWLLKKNRMEQMRKLPIGIQTFEKLREENYLYVDKTALVYRIASTSVPYFLSRPRRFGKSLLISTLEAGFFRSGVGGSGNNSVRISPIDKSMLFYQYRNSHPGGDFQNSVYR